MSKNCTSALSESIQEILHLRPIPPTARHLGLPLFLHRNKNLAFEELKTKIFDRLSGWKSKLLSQAARTILIKTVANSLPSYSMSLFFLPKSFCQTIDSWLRKFWWGISLDKKRSLNLLGWHKICSPKSVGGLGLRTMELQNMSLLAKLGWSMLNSPDSLWVKVLASKYLHGTSFLSTSGSASASWLWKGILKCRHIVLQGACWLVSSGTNLNIWDSPWIPSIVGFKPAPNPSLPSLPNLTISDLIAFPNRGWNFPLLHFLFDPPTVNSILSIHLPAIPALDRWIWAPSSSGRFSVKSAHEVASSFYLGQPSPLSPSDWNCLWGLKVQLRLKHFLWKITWNILPVRTNIFKFVSNVDQEVQCCPFCLGPLETLQHIFFECPLARLIWFNSNWPMNLTAFTNLPIGSWTQALLRPHDWLGIPVKEVHNFQLSALILLDQIWLARNILIHKGVQPNPQKIWKVAKSTIEIHLSAWRSSPGMAEWIPPVLGSFTANFDVAIRPSFAVAAATLRDHKGEFLAVNTLKLPPMDANLGEAHAALLAVRMAASLGCTSLCLEGDSLVTVLAIKDPFLFSDWISESVISDISLQLLSFSDWKVSKISRCANFCAHQVARWAAANHVFGSIPPYSPFISALRFRSGKDPPL